VRLAGLDPLGHPALNQPLQPTKPRDPCTHLPIERPAQSGGMGLEGIHRIARQRERLLEGSLRRPFRYREKSTSEIGNGGTPARRQIAAQVHDDLQRARRSRRKTEEIAQGAEFRREQNFIDRGGVRTRILLDRPEPGRVDPLRGEGAIPESGSCAGEPPPRHLRGAITPGIHQRPRPYMLPHLARDPAAVHVRLRHVVRFSRQGAVDFGEQVCVFLGAARICGGVIHLDARGIVIRGQESCLHDRIRGGLQWSANPIPKEVLTVIRIDHSAERQTIQIPATFPVRSTGSAREPTAEHRFRIEREPRGARHSFCIHMSVEDNDTMELLFGDVARHIFEPVERRSGEAFGNRSGGRCPRGDRACCMPLYHKDGNIQNANGHNIGYAMRQYGTKQTAGLVVYRCVKDSKAESGKQLSNIQMMMAKGESV
jgi:hypothetical protein